MSITGINGYNYSNYYTGTKRNTAKANGMNSGCAPSKGCVVKPVGFRFIQGLANQIIASLGMMPVTASDKRRQQESRVE